MKLSIEEVNYSYDKKRKKKALNNLTVELERGVYGLLGANGAGKTTLISLIVRLLTPQSGAICLDGREIREMGAAYFDHIGYLPQNPRFYPNFTVREFMLYMAKLKGIKKNDANTRCDELLRFVNLEQEQGKRLGSCSGGMRQRAGIAEAMLNNPDILILDEPTAGLDPLERIRFRNIISQLGEDRIILLATHIVPDVEYIAQNILLLKNGELLHSGSCDSLILPVSHCVWEMFVNSELDVIKMMRSFRISNVRRNNNSYTLRIVSETKPSPSSVSIQPTLEDVYLWHFGEEVHGYDMV